MDHHAKKNSPTFARTCKAPDEEGKPCGAILQRGQTICATCAMNAKRGARVHVPKHTR